MNDNFKTVVSILATGYVPYTGASEDVNLGEHGLAAAALTINGDSRFSDGSTVFGNRMETASSRAPIDHAFGRPFVAEVAGF